MEGFIAFPVLYARYAPSSRANLSSKINLKPPWWGFGGFYCVSGLIRPVCSLFEGKSIFQNKSQTSLVGIWRVSPGGVRGYIVV